MTTETIAVPAPPALTPPTVGDLSPERIGASREKWIGHGYDPATFDAALGGKASPSLTPEQTASAIAKLRQAGVPEERIIAAMEADGITPKAENRTPEQIEHDRDFGFDRPAFEPSDYLISHAAETKTRGPDHVAAVDASAKDFLAVLNITPALGAALIEHAVEKGQAWSKASETERELYKREQRAIGLKACGGSPEKLSETIALAGQTIRLALGGKGDFAEALVKSGAANDWWLISTLANQSRHTNAWAKDRPGKPEQ